MCLYKEKGIKNDRDFSTKIGMSPSTVSRNLNGKNGAGGDFIANVLKEFTDYQFDELFESVGAIDQHAATLPKTG
jgi:transcriptional regulator with XRE-family HTH domain